MDWNQALTTAMQNPLFQFGTGMLAAPRGATFGQALGAGVGNVQAAQKQALQNRLLEAQQTRQNQLLELQKQQQEYAQQMGEKRFGLQERQQEIGQEQFGKTYGLQKRQQEIGEEQFEKTYGLQQEGLGLRKASAGLQAQLDARKIMLDQAKTDLENRKLEAETVKTEAEAQEKQMKAETKKKEDKLAYQGAVGRIDNAVNTIDRLLANPELTNVVGPLEGREWYPSTLIGMIKSNLTYGMAGDVDARTNAAADIKAVQSQQFLNNLMEIKQQGGTFGSLTEREGSKLENYVANLDPAQGEKQYIANLKEIQRLLMKSRGYLNERYQETSVPDTPNVQYTPEDINNLVNKYSGQ